MVSTPDDSSLSSNQDINQFLVYAGIELISLIQLSETLPVELTETYQNFISWEVNEDHVNGPPSRPNNFSTQEPQLLMYTK